MTQTLTVATKEEITECLRTAIKVFPTHVNAWRNNYALSGFFVATVNKHFKGKVHLDDLNQFVPRELRRLIGGKFHWRDRIQSFIVRNRILSE